MFHRGFESHPLCFFMSFWGQSPKNLIGFSGDPSAGASGWHLFPRHSERSVAAEKFSNTRHVILREWNDRRIPHARHVILSTLPNKTIKYRFVRGRRISSKFSNFCPPLEGVPKSLISCKMSGFPQDLNVILRRTSRGWKALAVPVYCECEKPKDLLKNFTVILRLSRRIPLKRHEILRAPPSEWHDLDKMGRSLSSLCQN